VHAGKNVKSSGLERDLTACLPGKKWNTKKMEKEDGACWGGNRRVKKRCICRGEDRPEWGKALQANYQKQRRPSQRWGDINGEKELKKVRSQSGEMGCQPGVEANIGIKAIGLT